MIGRRRFFLSFIFILFGFFLVLSGLPGKEISLDSQSVTRQDKDFSAKVVSVPATPREKTGVYVFLGWIWIVILILFYFIRQKIKELDRLYEIGFFSD